MFSVFQQIQQVNIQQIRLLKWNNRGFMWENNTVSAYLKKNKWNTFIWKQTPLKLNIV